MAVKARIIGVHAVAVADDPVHLIEIEVENGDIDFDFAEVTQELPGEPRGNWQAAYDERKVGEGRYVFFFHYLNTSKPLLTSAGALEIPPASPLPEHLHGITYWPP